MAWRGIVWHSTAISFFSPAIYFCPSRGTSAIASLNCAAMHTFASDDVCEFIYATLIRSLRLILLLPPTPPRDLRCTIGQARCTVERRPRIDLSILYDWSERCVRWRLQISPLISHGWFPFLPLSPGVLLSSGRFRDDLRLWIGLAIGSEIQGSLGVR